ncbi:hypothetical protein chiPu_0015979 [Chiloscyllium punctatum]|uniref:Uncharacterized protein n=1 Tax=Chiloscyllium punctatum TaxID=137246 RepID=A0A401T4C3_CHIPU|nr:hypothetical protein [Chiloscyllium punctatum]
MGRWIRRVAFRRTPLTEIGNDSRFTLGTHSSQKPCDKVRFTVSPVDNDMPRGLTVQTHQDVFCFGCESGLQQSSLVMYLFVLQVAFSRRIIPSCLSKVMVILNGIFNSCRSRSYIWRGHKESKLHAAVSSNFLVSV